MSTRALGKYFCPQFSQETLEEVTAIFSVKRATQNFEEYEKSRSHDTTKESQ